MEGTANCAVEEDHLDRRAAGGLCGDGILLGATAARFLCVSRAGGTEGGDDRIAAQHPVCAVGGSTGLVRQVLGSPRTAMQSRARSAPRRQSDVRARCKAARTPAGWERDRERERRRGGGGVEQPVLLEPGRI